MNKEFFLVHKPQEGRLMWKGWIIHGHKHNNHPQKFPLINSDNKTINVSVELINYKPVLLEELITEELEHIQYWNNIKDEPVYFPYMQALE
ncbi:MAG: hypothetical protein KKF46_05175 [Nanoarchaeota archaeon]|nr:hypothetical protein [Nanoarchaeota archaeon]MBU1321725.1 hypothetical protein [Nanoarchaeota archaeon]MBU1597691.1 hypothetical protein [Nanoarchaeota archaeon]MBU2440747.1 hypothetical protein [Nanoarchaeota archaeon]